MKEQVQALLQRVPALDVNIGKDETPPGRLKVAPRAGKFTGPTWTEAEAILNELIALGPEGILAAVDEVHEVDDGADYRARYLLHTMTVWLCRPGKETERRAFEQTLLKALDSERPAGQKNFLIQQLRTGGSLHAAPALGQMLRDEALYEEAALALQAMGLGAASEFRNALPHLSGKAETTAVQALGYLKDPEAVPLLIQAIQTDEEDTKICALWALAQVAAPEGIPTVAGAVGGDGWFRTQAIKAALLLADNLIQANQQQAAMPLLKKLQSTCTDDSEAYVRAAAARLMKV